MTMGLPKMLQLRDITTPLPQRLSDLDEDDFHRVDRLIAFTKLTMVMDEVSSSMYVPPFFPRRYRVFSNC
jgi:hypothetical protein